MPDQDKTAIQTSDSPVDENAVDPLQEENTLKDEEPMEKAETITEAKSMEEEVVFSDEVSKEETGMIEERPEGESFSRERAEMEPPYSEEGSAQEKESFYKEGPVEKEGMISDEGSEDGESSSGKGSSSDDSVKEETSSQDGASGVKAAIGTAAVAGAIGALAQNNQAEQNLKDKDQASGQTGQSNQEDADKERSGRRDSGQKNRKKKKRYQGYDVEQITSRRYQKSKPWFWKVLFISLLLSAAIVVGACAYFINGDRKKTDYLAGMNEANNMQALLEGHKNVSITESFSHLAEDKDYTLTRIVTKTKSGEYYSYLKKIQDEDTNKEVIRNKIMYRYDESFPRYVALVGDNYEKICIPEIEGCVFQNDGNETIEDQKDKGELVNIKASVTVQEGDRYNITYGFDPGTKIDKTIVMDKESGIVTSETESSGGEEFYSYIVEYDGETKVPYFYKKIKEKTDTRECTVYVDDGTGEWKEYNYDVPMDVYFTVLEQDGYRCYADKDCTKEFSEYQISVQNPESSVTLYLKKEPGQETKTDKDDQDN